MRFNFSIFKRVFNFAALMLLVTIIGTLGFYFIEGWSFIESFYMTVITLSTVGFKEVHQLSSTGQIFTILLIIVGFGIFAYTISRITSYFLGGEYNDYVLEHRVIKKLKKMENHVIICGFGRVGKQVAEDLTLYGQQFVIIEKDEGIINENKNKPGYFFLLGDSTRDEILESASVEKAGSIITCLPKDTDNIYVVLAAREFNAKILIIARATNGSAISKLRMAGATKVIMPDSIGGSHMASLITNPLVTEFMDLVKVQGSEGVNIESISFNELPEDLRNKTIGELDAKRLTGVTVIGFKTPDGKYIINPDLQTEVVPKSQLFVLGNAIQIEKLNLLYGIKTTR